MSLVFTILFQPLALIILKNYHKYILHSVVAPLDNNLALEWGPNWAIPRSRDVIAHSSDTKLPGEDGEDVAMTGIQDPIQRQNPLEKMSEVL